jgi:hypothetical protein
MLCSWIFRPERGDNRFRTRAEDGIADDPDLASLTRDLIKFGNDL